MEGITKPEPLGPEHTLWDFDCGSKVLNSWLQNSALKAQLANSSRTFVVLSDKKVIGFFSLATASLLYAELPQSQRNNLGQHPVPMMLLTRMGVDKSFQHRGLGAAMVKDAVIKCLAVQQAAGLVGLMAHALDESVAEFYLKLGFERSPANPLLLSLGLLLQGD